MSSSNQVVAAPAQPLITSADQQLGYHVLNPVYLLVSST